MRYGAETMWSARNRWPRLTAAVARYMAGPEPTDDDLANADDAVGDYMVWRATAESDDPTAAALRQAISASIAAR